MRRWCWGSLNCVERDRNLGISSSSPGGAGEDLSALGWVGSVSAKGLGCPGGTHTDGAISVGQLAQ